MSAAADGIETASLSDVGLQRTVNQDRCAEFERPGGDRLLVVADGMGGHQGGEIASLMAVETVGEVFAASRESPERVLRMAIEQANDRVLDAARDNPGLHGMGTTAVCLIVRANGQGVVANIGDSRAYRLRGDAFTQLTEDHSVVGEMQRRGLLTREEALTHPRRNEILRSIGAGPNPQIDVHSIGGAPGDRLLLCTDGLCGVVPDAEIANVLGGQPPQEAVRTLVRRANDAGGPDNVTVVIAVLPGQPGSTDVAPRPAVRLDWRWVAAGAFALSAGGLLLCG
jgi:protein phosphatase